MDYLILGKVVGGHVIVLIGLLINHFIKNDDNSFAQKSKPIPMRVVTTAPLPAPPAPPAPKPPVVKPKKPEVKKPEPVVVQKPKPKPPAPKPKPVEKKPEPKKVDKKPAAKPKPKPVVREPDPPPVPIVQKTPSPAELMAQLQALAPPPTPVPPKPVTNVRPQPPRPVKPIQQARRVVPPTANQMNALQNRVEQECLARSWSANKPNRIIQNLTAIAVARVHRNGSVRFAGFKLRSGDQRMDEAVRITIERGGCHFPLPANAPDFIDLSIEFELNP